MFLWSSRRSRPNHITEYIYVLIHRPHWCLHFNPTRFRSDMLYHLLWKREKEAFGNLTIIVAMLAVELLVFVVWVHVVFTAGTDGDTRSYLTSAAVIIVVPTGIKIFGSLATIWVSTNIHIHLLTTRICVYRMIPDICRAYKNRK